MTRFQVDSEMVLAKSGTARSTIERIRAETSQLHAQLSDLQNVWTGQAATAFQAASGEWRQMAQRVEESLASLSHALESAGRQYADIETANARLFGR